MMKLGVRGGAGGGIVVGLVVGEGKDDKKVVSHR